MTMTDIETRWTDQKDLPYGVGGRQRVYAIGDVHGCASLLQALLAEIERDFLQQKSQRPEVQGTLIYLGDLVDRGPDSRGVLDLVLQGPPAGLHQVVLKGNHEVLMNEFLSGDEERAPLWLINGGAETLQSYGVSAPENTAPGTAYDVQRSFAKRVPRQHQALLRDAPLSHQIGDVFFAHAGVNPEFSLGGQVADDLLWIREPFLSAETDFGAFVVHGHTPHNGHEVYDNRANADTGAVYGGWLSAIVIEDRTLQFVQVSDGESHFIKKYLTS